MNERLKLDIKKLNAALNTTFEADIQSGRVGGIAALVMQNGKTVYQNCFSNEKLGIHVSEHTIFRLASMSKPVTTAAVLILADRGELRLDDPVYYYIPEYETMNLGRVNENGLEIVGPAKNQITIRHLLTHSSGIGGGPVGQYVSSQLPTKERKCLEQTVKFFAQNPLDYEPSTRQAYSGVNAFDVLSRIVEIVSQMSFSRFLEKEIFVPLGMTDTTFTPTKEQWGRMIPMHTYEEGEGKIVDFPENSIFEGIPTTCFSGGAALASTLYDYKLFADMLLHYGSARGKQLIGEKWIREMARPQLPDHVMKNDRRNWGLGVRVITNHPDNVLPCGTFGWSGAYGGHFWVDPVNEIVAVYLKNSRYDGGSGAQTGVRFEKDVYASFL